MWRSRALVFVHEWSELDIDIDMPQVITSLHSWKIQVARDPPHGQHLRSLVNRDKNQRSAFAFFNGVAGELGNIWGIWNGITPLDAEATLRVATIERAVAPFLVSPGWEPMFRCCGTAFFAGRWPLNDSDRVDHRQPQ